jgi:hypothetical protein
VEATDPILHRKIARISNLEITMIGRKCDFKQSFNLPAIYDYHIFVLIVEPRVFIAYVIDAITIFFNWFIALEGLDLFQF